jgi:predicted anti-sigma-YlaC factor YlaD
MDDTRDYPRWVRFAVGRPRIWVGIAWCVVGLAWAILGISSISTNSGAVWAYLGLAVLFAVIGIVLLLVAFRDRRRQHGSYARPVSASTDRV